MLFSRDSNAKNITISSVLLASNLNLNIIARRLVHALIAVYAGDGLKISCKPKDIVLNEKLIIFLQIL
jgi:hypothetical protein